MGAGIKMENQKIVDIDLTEQMAFSWPDNEIEGWRNYRIEYGGCNQECYYEGVMWLPPHVSSEVMGYKLFEILQVPEAYKEYHKAVLKIHKKKVGDKSGWREHKSPLKHRLSWKIKRMKRWLSRTFLPMD